MWDPINRRKKTLSRRFAAFEFILCNNDKHIGFVRTIRGCQKRLVLTSLKPLLNGVNVLDFIAK